MFFTGRSRPLAESQRITIHAYEDGCFGPSARWTHDDNGGAVLQRAGGSQPSWKGGNVRASYMRLRSDLKYKATGSRCTRIRARANARAPQFLLSQELVERSGNS